MTIPARLRRAPLPRRILFLAACVLALGGCATEKQVRSIVTDSNYQMLLASSPGLETGLATNPATGGGADADAATRINAFLAAHPDDPVLTGALRLRQILIYLNQRAFALADAGADKLDPSALHSARDQALAAAYPDLRWWAEYSLTAEFTFADTQKAAALRHIASLEQRANGEKLAALPDLRDYFLEMRAWIGLKLGLATANDPAFTTDTIQQAVDAWTGTFTAAELELLNSGDFKSAKPFDLSTRRVIRARNLLDALAAARRIPPGLNLPPPPPLVFSQPAVNAYFAAASR